MDSKWYIIQAYAGCENVVKQSIDKIVQENNLSDKVKNVFIPTETITTTKNGTEKKRNRIMYPGYIFVNLVLDPDVYIHLEHISKTNGFMKTDKVPAVISEEEIEKIIIKSKSNLSKLKFEIGEIVRIVDGLYANFNGVIEKFIDDSVILNVTVMGEKTIIELAISQIEKTN